ncbi:predicted protein, partial [Arabidopsis lyrata subsp. lyrata]
VVCEFDWELYKLKHFVDKVTEEGESSKEQKSESKIIVVCRCNRLQRAYHRVVMVVGEDTERLGMVISTPVVMKTTNTSVDDDDDEIQE